MKLSELNHPMDVQAYAEELWEKYHKAENKREKKILKKEYNEAAVRYNESRNCKILLTIR